MIFFKKNTRIFFYIISLIVSAFAGTMFIHYTWAKFENEKSKNVSQIAKSISVLLPKDHIKMLEAKSIDIEKQEFKVVKNTLEDIIRINKNARFAYLYTQRNGKIFLAVI